MAKLSIGEVEHIAKLSKLKLEDKEKEEYCEQLSSVLDYVSQLNEVDTDNIPPMANITGLESVFREDEVEPSGIIYSDIAKNAPKFEDGFFVVPGVFE